MRADELRGWRALNWVLHGLGDNFSHESDESSEGSENGRPTRARARAAMSLVSRPLQSAAAAVEA